jgi:hypothetical protein
MLTFGIPDYVSNDMTLHYGAISIKNPIWMHKMLVNYLEEN